METFRNDYELNGFFDGTTVADAPRNAEFADWIAAGGFSFSDEELGASAGDIVGGVGANTSTTL